MALHSKIGASSAKRWMTCPASVRACADIPEQPASPHALEGTAAHALAELCLKEGVALASDFEGVEIGEGEARRVVTAEMADAVQVYLDQVYSVALEGTELYVELRVNLADIHPDMFGTSDCAVWVPNTGTLYIFDYKHGAGVPVPVEGNPQVLFYAAGTVRHLQLKGLKRIVCVVVQPRAPGQPVKTWELSPVELFEWEAFELRPAVERIKDPAAPFVAGEHCRWCPAAKTCKAFETQARAAAVDGLGRVVDPTTLAAAELGERLAQADLLLAWCKTIREHAESEAKAGRVPIGFKMVEGRATRYFEEEDALKLSEMFDGADLYEHKLVSPAKLEALVGKKRASEAAHLVRRKPGGLLLVPASDERPAANVTAAHGFRALPESLA